MVEAEAGALPGIGIMMTVLIVDVVLAEEILTDIMATKVGAGFPGAVVLEEEAIVVEVQWVGIEVQSEKVVQKEELKLSNGTERRKLENLATRTIGMTMTKINRVLHRTEVNMMTIRYSGSLVTALKKGKDNKIGSICWASILVYVAFPSSKSV